MRFKNTTCLKKVWVNQAETKMNEHEIFFNDSKITLTENSIILDIKGSEVLFLANSSKNRKYDSYGKKPEYEVEINWVDCYSGEIVEKELSDDEINVLIVTKEVYDVLKERLVEDELIYEDIYKIGISQTSTNLKDVKNFCVITCSIVHE